MGTQAKNDTKTAHVMNLIGRGTTDRVLPAQPKGSQPRDIETITAEILEAKRTGGEAILTIGRGLMEAKAQLSHGEWLPWLENRVDFSESTAQKFMRLAQKYTNPATLTDLGKSKALILLALPDEVRDEYIEVPHVVNGEEKTVYDMSARELAQAIKERDAALKAAEEAKAGQSAAELAREKMEQDMAIAKQLLEAAQAERDRTLQEAQSHEAALAESARNVARLEKELEELRSRPVDVAVEADAAAIEAARKEAEAAMQAKLDEVRKAQAREETARKAAEEAKVAAQQELEKAQAEVRSVREQAAKAEKRSEAISNEDFMAHRAMMLQMGAQFNQVTGILMNLQRKSPKLLPAALAAVVDFDKTVQKVIASYQGVTAQ